MENPETTLINYAIFCGSIQIAKYLEMNRIQLTQQSWKYSIHSNNSEMISYLEDMTKPSKSTLLESFKESIKCHHNDVMYYIMNNEAFNDGDFKVSDYLIYHNFAFTLDKFEIEYNYFYLVKCITFFYSRCSYCHYYHHDTYYQFYC